MSTAQTAVKDDQGKVWKALADGTRRKILDLIREAPRTTGDLVEQFEHLGRCAVMKHLGILERAGLIIVRREGRKRWNSINAIPVQMIYERWVRKYEEQWASGLIQLKKHAENSTLTSQLEETIQMESQLGMININMEISIEAPIEKTWSSLVNEIGQWWRKDFYSSPKAKGFHLEARPGGRMYEDYGNDEGLVWANVIVIDAPHVLELKGHLSPQWGGPSVAFLRIQLEATSDGTMLNFSDTHFGAVDEKTKASLSEGWKMMFAEAFKAYVEK